MSPRLKLTALLATAIAVVTVAAIGATFASAARVAPRRVGTAPVLPAGSTTLGSLPSGTEIHVDVTLEPNDPAALSAYATAVSTPGSPDFHRYLTVAQFRQRFAPSDAQIATVEASLTAAGLAPDPVSANGLSIKVTATASQLASAFDTTIEQVALPGGRVAFTNTSAPQLSAGAASLVQGVVGLNNLVTEQPTLVRPQRLSAAAARTHAGVRASGRAVAKPDVSSSASSPAPSSAGCTGSNAITTDDDSAGEENAGVSAYEPSQIAATYGIDSLWSSGDYGSGQTVGLVEFAPYVQADLTAYEQCFFGEDPTFSTTTVDGAPTNSGNGSEEADLDIEEILGLAPASNIAVYEAPNGDQYDLLDAMVQNTSINVISDSWASCEIEANPATGTAGVSSVNTLLEESATEGQSFFASSGDDGSTACYPADTAGNAARTPNVNFPASSPWVTGVGGTMLVASGSGDAATASAADQDVWNESGRMAGATGGGVSTDFTMPSYQRAATVPGIISSGSSTTACNGGANYCREVPDVSALADPETGYVIYYNGAWTSVGGTSAAAPVWGAIAALANASSACAGNAVGFVNPLLYSIASNATEYANDFTDITTAYGGSSSSYPADNDYSPSGYTGGLYPVGTGYDMSTGLGSPKVPDLVPNLCALATAPTSLTVTTASPAIAADGTSTTQVTVTVENAAGSAVTGQAAKITLTTSGGQTLSTLTAQGNGTYTATLTGTKTQGVSTITATDGALTGTTQLTQAILEIQELRISSVQGSASSPSFVQRDGYVELYNESAYPVSLSGWSLSLNESYENEPYATQPVSLTGVTVPAYGHVLAADSSYNADLGPTSDGGDGGPAADVSFESDIFPDGVALDSPGDSAPLDAVGFTASSYLGTIAAPAGYYSGTRLNSPAAYYYGEIAWTRKFSDGVPVNTQNNLDDFVMVDTSSAVTGNASEDANAGNPVPGAPSPESTLSPVDENAFLQSGLVNPAAAETASPNAIYTASGPTLDVNRTVANCSGLTSANRTSYPAACANALTGTTPVTVMALQFRITGLSTGVIEAQNSTTNTPTAGTTVDGLSLEAPAVSPAGLNAVWSATPDIGSGLMPGQTVNVDFDFDVVAHGSYSFAYDTEDDLLPYTGPLPGDPGTSGTSPDPSGAGSTSTDTTPTDTTPTDTTPDTGAGSGADAAPAGVTTDAGDTVVTGTISPSQFPTAATTTTATPVPVTAVAVVRHAVLRLRLVHRDGRATVALTGLTRGVVKPGTTLTVRSRLLRRPVTIRVSAHGTFSLNRSLGAQLKPGRYRVTVMHGATVLATGQLTVSRRR